LTPPAFPPVRIVSGPAFELVAELAAFASGPARASLESGKPWIREVRALAGPDLLRRIDRWAFGLYAELASIVAEAGAPYEPGQLVATLRAMPPDAVRRRLLGADSAPNRAMVSDGAFDRALAGDADAQAELRTALSPNRSARQSIDRLLNSPPEAVPQDVAGIVEDWAERVFPVFARDALAIVARDAAAKERQLASQPGRDLLRVAMNGVDVEPMPSVEEYVVVPTLAMRPFVAPVDWGSTAIFLCSVADEAFDDGPAAPPRRLVKLAAALGDETRLRILNVLSSSELTASEIADRLGVERTSLHHHLGILRSAGLLKIHDDGLRGWRFARAADGAGDLGAALAEYLRPPLG
jgi:DNA-binding transcriptional ArsR family regulator